MRPRIMYIENKAGGVSGGTARIGWVSFSKSGQTLYYAGKSFRSLKRAGRDPRMTLRVYTDVTGLSPEDASQRSSQ